MSYSLTNDSVTNLYADVTRRDMFQPRRKPSVFGQTLRRFREQARLSQSKLAEIAEYDTSYISRLESGARTPSRDMVVALGQAMALQGAELDELMMSAGFMPTAIESLFVREPEVGRILEVLNRTDLPEPVRHDIRTSLAALTRLANRYAAVALAEAGR